MWTPTVEGNYLIVVTVKDGISGMEKSVTAPYEITGLTSVTLTSQFPSPGLWGIPQTFTASSTGGSNMQYQFWVYNPTGTPAWTLAQDFSSNAVLRYVPDIPWCVEPGPYMFSVTALDGNTGVSVSTTLWYTFE